MLRDFNLLVTTSRGNERETCDELRFLLGEIGDSKPEVEKTGVSGLIAAKTALDPREVVQKLRRILSERPYEFRFTFRVVPVEKVIQTDLVGIELAAVEFASRIDENETFRITLEKRFSSTPTQSIIEAAASSIKRKVNLEKPDWILLIEVVGSLTGMSLLRPNDVLSSVKEKML
jgi:tRNA acetyltransferase TAN1